MLKAIRKRMEDREEGFTLIELMVVVLIIAILIAIAIPTFLGARKRAQDRAAQSNLRNGLTAEKVYYTDEEAYIAGAAGGEPLLQAIEPTLVFDVAVDSADAKVLSVAVNNVTPGGGGVAAQVDDSVVCLFAQSASGAVFGVKDVAVGDNAGTYYTSNSAAACSETGVDADWLLKW